MKSIKRRLEDLEARIKRKKLLFPGDEDGFLAALGVELRKFARINPDGSTGYDAIKALADTAREDWANE